MGFDIPNLHLDESSPEGRVVREIVDREGVTPEETVRAALRRGDVFTSVSAGKEPIEKDAERLKRDPKAIIGAFSSPEDVVLIDEIMEDIRARREYEARYYADR